ncbi:MAG: hypothetical protein WAW42_15775 [Candidatus Competibacteraceae bacterium]
MNSWQLSWIVLVALVTVIGSGGWFILRHGQQRKQQIERRLRAMEKAAADKAAAEKAAEEQKAQMESAAVARTTERIAAKRLAMEQAAAERAELEKATVEQAIAEWAAAEQAEAGRVRAQRASENRLETEMTEERMRAVEDAIAEWLEAEREGNRLAATTTPGNRTQKTYTRTEALQQQVRSVAALVEKEIHDLDFIKNRIEADVDFLPIEFQQTIEDWKAGKILRRSTFDDLKLKFRYKAYSIEDGYEMFYLYNQWLSQQQQKLWVFIRLLGTEVDPSESIQAAIERAEHAEREKYLEMDVDVIFTLRDIRTILERLISMETVLKELEVVCRKRSEQIIAPPWEARGSL